LRKFDTPHKKIHGIAATVAKSASEGSYAEAQKVIDETRDGSLAAMVRLFAELKGKVRDALVEAVVVLVSWERACGVAVDKVETVEAFELEAMEQIRPIAAPSDRLVAGLGRRARDQRLVTFLDADAILSEIGT
jgi:chemotaxis signal transduction protein